MKYLIMVLTVLSLNASASIKYTQSIDIMTGVDSSSVIIKQNKCTTERCEFIVLNNSGDLKLMFSRYLGDMRYYAKVIVKFDDCEIEDLSRYLSGKNLAAIMADDKKSEFTVRLKSSNVIMIRSINHRGELKTSTFNLKGLPDELEKINGFNKYLAKSI